MASRARRSEALSREQIVDTAIGLLDASGVAGLTFKALSERLVTGPGALYHHVGDKAELLAAATDAVVASALVVAPTESPREAIRTVALGLFDGIDAHPWVAAQLSESSWQATAPRILESLGGRVRALGVPRSAWFTTTTVLMQYILGAAAQNAANGMAGLDRGGVLAATAERWRRLEEFPFAQAVADQMREHDDREQFLAGVDLILAGVAAAVP